MGGSVADMLARMRLVLPVRWFADVAPLRDALFQGLAAGWAALYDLIVEVQLQTRLLTASGTFLDLTCLDFFGSELLRKSAESDDLLRARAVKELLRARASRAAVAQALENLTGNEPVIFEPARPADTGGYNVGGVGYGVGGGWGSLTLPFQFFLAARRPSGGGIAFVAGYGSGGVPVYGSRSLLTGVVTDEEIFRVVTQTLPAATTAWVRITG